MNASPSAHNLLEAILLPGSALQEPPAFSGQGVWDDRLAALAAKGDAESFRVLVESYQTALHSFCCHILGCAEDARDACQEIFVRAWHALPYYEGQGRFRAWLWRIAVNLCSDRLRAQRRRKSSLIAWSDRFGEELVCPDQTPAEAAHWRGEMEMLARALDVMPDSLRWPLTLCLIEGLSQAECAAVLNLSIRAVEGRIHRARAWLQAWWGRQL